LHVDNKLTFIEAELNSSDVLEGNYYFVSELEINGDITTLELSTFPSSTNVALSFKSNTAEYSKEYIERMNDDKNTIVDIHPYIRIGTPVILDNGNS